MGHRFWVPLHRMALSNAWTAFGEEFCESLLSSLVLKKGQNRHAVTIDDADDLYHLISPERRSQG